jgi:predicted RNA-binding Zn-ribbon protein involved in translation (DUF1610 family)
MNLIQDIRDLLKNTRHRRPTHKYCPKCGNPHIHATRTYLAGITPANYTCEECGYHGPVIMELEKEN